jgi:dimethylglycine dehydrogenase
MIPNMSYFQEDLERLEPHIESAMNRVPAFGESGVKRVYNGAIAYTPDGNPIVGPAWDLPNFWLNEGHSFGHYRGWRCRMAAC